MEVVVAPDAHLVAADAVEALVRERPRAVLGLATGSSPLPLYAELVHRRRAGTGPAYDRVRCFLLDEYVGLPPGHPQRYRETVRRELTDPLGIDPARVAAPDVDAPDLDRAGPGYEAALAATGGVDLQLLGIGSNGHLAFNEPGSPLDSLTRVATLTDRTRRDNARFFDADEEVPRRVVTQGLGTIRRARHLVLLARGSAKAAAVAAALDGPVTPDCPASVLQLHDRVTVLLDDAAAARLR